MMEVQFDLHNLDAHGITLAWATMHWKDRIARYRQQQTRKKKENGVFQGKATNFLSPKANTKLDDKPTPTTAPSTPPEQQTPPAKPPAASSKASPVPAIIAVPALVVAASHNLVKTKVLKNTEFQELMDSEPKL